MPFEYRPAGLFASASPFIELCQFQGRFDLVVGIAGRDYIWAQLLINKESYMDDRDLIALWEAHCRYEFETRDVDATMATMVADSYVNHIPTMTGGVGRDQLKRFYKYHFVGVNPPDFRLTSISRTVGASCVVDEFIVHFTHTTEMDWLLGVCHRPDARFRSRPWPS